MADASEIHGVAFKNASATLLARVVGADGTPITPSDVASAKYTAYLLDESDPDRADPIGGHTDMPVEIADLVANGLHKDALWDVDDVGYNFKHVLDVAADQVFATAGRMYRVAFELTPTEGQVIVVRFRIHAI
jgi:hypothetical protein